nr:immunoglobulin light chain junction region [Macaca mulatta]
DYYCTSYTSSSSWVF